MSQPYDTPLFGDPEPPKAQRKLSHKDLDDAANKITWTRYKVAGVQCSDCVLEHTKGQRAGIGSASWMRVQGEDKRVLCYHHKAEYLARGDKPPRRTHTKGT
jgi:hypothetical protein